MKTLLVVLILALGLWWLWPEAPGPLPPAAAQAATPPAPVVVQAALTPPQAGPVRQVERPERIPATFLRWLDTRYGSDPALRGAMLQLAEGWASAVNDVHDRASAKRAGDRIARGIACVMDARTLSGSGQDGQWAYQQIMEARSEMLADDARTDAYLRFQELAAGQYFADPGPEPCGAGAG